MAAIPTASQDIAEADRPVIRYVELDPPEMLQTAKARQTFLKTPPAFAVGGTGENILRAPNRTMALFNMARYIDHSGSESKDMTVFRGFQRDAYVRGKLHEHLDIDVEVVVGEEEIAGAVFDRVQAQLTAYARVIGCCFVRIGAHKGSTVRSLLFQCLADEKIFEVQLVNVAKIPNGKRPLIDVDALAMRRGVLQLRDGVELPGGLLLRDIKARAQAKQYIVVRQGKLTDAEKDRINIFRVRGWIEVEEFY